MKQKDDPIGQWRSRNAIEQMTAEEANRIAQQIAAKEAQRTFLRRVGRTLSQFMERSLGYDQV